MPPHTDILHVDGLHADIHADASHGDVGDILHVDDPSAHLDAPVPHVDSGGHDDGPPHIDIRPPDAHGDVAGLPGLHTDRGVFHADTTSHDDVPHFDLGNTPGLPDFAGAFTALSAHIDAVVGQVITMMTELMRQQHALLQTMTSTMQTGMIGVQTSLSLVQQQQLRTLPDLMLQLQSLRDKDAAAERDRIKLHQQTLAQVGEQASAALETIRQTLRDRIQLATTLPPPVDAPPTAKGKWSAWTDATFAGMALGVDQWRLDAEFQNVRIVGGLAIGGPGALRSSTGFATTIRARLIHAHAPERLADAVSDAVWQAWKSWADHVTVPSLPWYPAFMAWPGPVAPPMPNTPCPLMLCPSSGIDRMMPPQLSAAITTRLSGSTIAGSDAGISTLARQVSAAFMQWLSTTNVTMALGSGTTAAALPFMPIAPVNGAVVHSRGCLAAAPSFPAAPSIVVP
jgi:hypothetical protein